MKLEWDALVIVGAYVPSQARRQKGNHACMKCVDNLAWVDPRKQLANREMSRYTLRVDNGPSFSSIAALASFLDVSKSRLASLLRQAQCGDRFVVQNVAFTVQTVSRTAKSMRRSPPPPRRSRPPCPGPETGKTLSLLMRSRGPRKRALIPNVAQLDHPGSPSAFKS